MGITKNIQLSHWWKTACKTPDSHFHERHKIMLNDHLEAVAYGAEILFDKTCKNQFVKEIQEYILKLKIAYQELFQILHTVALLHDIGKPYENHKVEVWHPLHKKMVQKRHQLVSYDIASQLIETDFPNRNLILNLILEHDTPYRWFRQMQVTGFIPKETKWLTLDKMIFPEAKGYGIILLTMFKLLDTHGHFNIDDVSWFIRKTNQIFLTDVGLEFPIPTDEDLRFLVNSGF